MPRKSRIDIPGLLTQVIVRGTELFYWWGRKIFQDRRLMRYCDYLARILRLPQKLSAVEALQQDANLKTILPPKLSLPKIQEVVGELFGIESGSIMQRTRMNFASEARAVLCYIAARFIGRKGTEVKKVSRHGANRSEPGDKACRAAIRGAF